MDRVTVPEAATLLGVTRDAVYKRVQREQIPWDKDEEGRVYVYVDVSSSVEDEATDPSTSAPSDGTRDDLLEALRDQNELLRAELAAWQEEARRKDAILMTMAQRIPELEVPPEPQETPEMASDERGWVEDQGDGERTQSTSWWRRLFGG